MGLARPWPGPRVGFGELRVGGEIFEARLEALACAPEGARALHIDLGSNAAALARRLIRRSHPQMRFRHEMPREAVLDLMKSSGFLHLRDGGGIPDGWYREASAAACDFVWAEHSSTPRAVGHVSMLRSYSKSWTSHQLATRSRHPETLEARHHIYRLISSLPTLVEDDEACMMIYFDRGRRWHRTFSTDFIGTMNDASHAVLTAWDRWELEDPAAAGSVTTPDPRVTRLDGEGAAWLARHLERRLPSLCRRALDLEEGRLVTDGLSPDVQSGGFYRRRDGFVARHKGQIVGAALMERTSTEISLFNLFNLAQLFFEDSAPPDLRRAVLDAVAARYAREGVRSPVIVAPPAVLAGCEGGRYALAETMGLMTWSARGLRQYQYFIEDRFAQRRAELSHPGRKHHESVR
ncbi:MAG: hypothetical protein AAFU79_16985 [Myxococcota bacterium]